MMRRLLGSSLACVLVACGGAQTGATTPTSVSGDAPDPSRAYALLPAETTAISYLDIAGIRKARLYETVRHDIAVWDARVRDMEGSDDGGSGAAPNANADATAEPSEFGSFLDLLDASSWVLIVDLPTTPSSETSAATSVETENTTESVVDLYIVAGHLEGNLVKGLLRSDAEKLLDGRVSMPGLGGSGPSDDGPAIEVRLRTVGERQVFDAGERAAAEFDDGLWVFGPPDRVEALLARADGDAPLEQTRTATIDQGVGLLEHHISLTAVGDSALPLLGGDDGGTFAMAEGGAATVDFDDGVVLRVIADAPTPEVAGTMRASLQERIDELLAESWVQLFGVDRILGGVHAEVEEARVSIAVDIAEGDARDLWGRAAGAVGAFFVVLDFFRGFGAAMAGPQVDPALEVQPPLTNEPASGASADAAP